jgi:hypothetical protein
LEYDKICFSNKRTNSTNESRNFFRDQIENLPKTTLFISCQQRKKKGKRGSVQPAKRRKYKKGLFSFFMEIAWKGAS